jgi:hypothetical protein
MAARRRRRIATYEVTDWRTCSRLNCGLRERFARTRAISHDQDMSALMWLTIGGVVVVVVGAWAFFRRGGDSPGPDLGTISGQWMAERRIHEREAGDR